MKRSLIISSMFCSALVIGCGDDKGEVSNSSPTTASNPTGDQTDSNSETGDEDPTTSNGSNVSNTDPSNPSDPSGDPSSTPSTDPGTATDDPSAGTDTTGTFIVEMDGGGGIKECDNWAQDCPAGQKCSAYAANGGSAWDSLKCVPVMENPAQPGDECTVEGNGVSGIDNCDLGSYCWDTNMENVGYCVALCTGSPEAAMCDSGFTCAIVNDGVLNLCLPGCDPIAQDCEMDDDLCVPTMDGFLCVLDASGEEGQQHDVCEYANACDKGLVCLNPTAGMECDPAAKGCCQPFCAISEGDAQCTGQGQACVPWYEEGQAPPGYEDVGACSIPA